MRPSATDACCSYAPLATRGDDSKPPAICGGSVTAIGDVVNTAARLQGEAKPGQMVISERVYQEVAERLPFTPPVELQLKGKSEPVSARVLSID